VGKRNSRKARTLSRIIDLMCHNGRITVFIISEVKEYIAAPGGRANGWSLPFDPPPGYVAYKFGRPGGEGRLGGGLAFFVRAAATEFHSVAGPMALATDESHYGAVGGVFLKASGVKVVVAGIYLPPDSTHHQTPSKTAIERYIPLLKTYAQQQDALFQGAGDINCDFITTTDAEGTNYNRLWHPHFSNTSQLADRTCESGRFFAELAERQRLVVVTGLREPALSSRDHKPVAGQPTRGHVIDVFFTAEHQQDFIVRANTCTAPGLGLDYSFLEGGHHLHCSDHKAIYAEVDVARAKRLRRYWTPEPLGFRYPTDQAGIRAAVRAGRRVRLLRNVIYGHLNLDDDYVQTILCHFFVKRLVETRLEAADDGAPPPSLAQVFSAPAHAPSQAHVEAACIGLVCAAHAAYEDASDYLALPNIYSREFFEQPRATDLRECTCASCVAAIARLNEWGHEPARRAEAEGLQDALRACFKRREDAAMGGRVEAIMLRDLKGILKRLGGDGEQSHDNMAPPFMRSSADSTVLVSTADGKKKILYEGALKSQINAPAPRVDLTEGVRNFAATATRAANPYQPSVRKTGAPLTYKEVADALAKIPNGVSPGLLGLNKEYAAALGPSFVVCLWVLCTWFWNHGIIAAMVTASFVAIIAKPHKLAYDLAKAFRTVSALSVIPKAMGHIGSDRLLDFLAASGLLHPGIYGAPGRSALLMVAGIILSERLRAARGLSTYALKLDMKGAYPSVCRTAMVTLLKEINTPFFIWRAVEALLRPGTWYVTTPFGPLEDLVTHTLGLKQGCPLSCVLIAVIGCLLLWTLTDAGVQHACVVPSPFGRTEPRRALHVYGSLYVDDLIQLFNGIATATGTNAYETAANLALFLLHMSFEIDKRFVQQITRVAAFVEARFLAPVDYLGVQIGPNSSLDGHMARNVDIALGDIDMLRRRFLIGRGTLPVKCQLVLLQLSFHAHAWFGLQLACKADCAQQLLALRSIHREAYATIFAWVYRNPAGGDKVRSDLYRHARSVFLVVYANELPAHLQFDYRVVSFVLKALRTDTAASDITEAHCVIRETWAATHAVATEGDEADVVELPPTFVGDAYDTARRAGLNADILDGSNVPSTGSLTPILRRYFARRFNEWIAEERAQLPATCWARRHGMLTTPRPRPYLKAADLVATAPFGVPLYTMLAAYGATTLLAKADMGKLPGYCNVCRSAGMKCSPGHILFVCSEPSHVDAREHLIGTVAAVLPEGSAGRAWLEEYLGERAGDEQDDRFASVMLDSDGARDHRRAHIGDVAERAFNKAHEATIRFMQAVRYKHDGYLRAAFIRFNKKRRDHLVNNPGGPQPLAEYEIPSPEDEAAMLLDHEHADDEADAASEQYQAAAGGAPAAGASEGPQHNPLVAMGELLQDGSHPGGDGFLPFEASLDDE